MKRRRAAVQPGQHLAPEVLLVLPIIEDLAGDDQGYAGFDRGIERQVKALLGADAPQRQGEIAFAHVGPQVFQGDAVFHKGKQAGEGGQFRVCDAETQCSQVSGREG